MRPLASLILLVAIASAEDTPRDLVRKILSTTDAKERAALVDALVARDPEPREVAKCLAQGRDYAGDVPKGWLDRTVQGSDGKERPYLLYVPQDYTPGKRYPFLVDMHGGVSRPSVLSHDDFEQMKFFWAEHAEREGWFLAIPSGQTGAEWWTGVGSGSVLSILAGTRRTYDIDENRVFATGFSDGGSGSYYLGLTSPTLLAGIVPLNGHIAVAQAGGLQVHLRNLVNVPIYAVNTTDDRLYPPESMRPLIDALKDLGANVTWHVIEGYGHDPSYLPGERPTIETWLDQRRRDPQPGRVVWEGATPGRVFWLRVTELGERKGDAFPDVNPKLPPDRVKIGVVVDREFAGPGVKVTEVQKGTPAAGIGIETGDVITGLDDVEIAGMQDLQRALRAKSHGDAFRIRLRRGEETVAKEGRFPEAKPEEGLGRDHPYGSISAEVKDGAVDVRANGVRAFEIYLSEPLLDLSKPLRVRVNGEVVHDAVVKPDLRFLVEQAVADDDRTMVYLARLRVEVPAQGS
jgi:poly(3-hydroxybutyrate) depolymerase